MKKIKEFVKENKDIIVFGCTQIVFTTTCAILATKLIRTEHELKLVRLQCDALNDENLCLIQELYEY